VSRKSSVTAENLAALGAERLAALLIELGAADRAVRKRLVLAVAERGGSGSLIKAVDRRLNALADSSALVPWEKEKAYAAEIDGLRIVITQSLAPLDAAAAADRLVRLIRLAPAVLRRVDDSNGRFGEIFRLAVADLAAVWGRIERREPEALAATALTLIQSDEYGLCVDLITEAAAALGAAGLAALKQRAAATVADLGEAHPQRGPGRARLHLLQILSDVADAEGDVDGFIDVQVKARGAGVDRAGIVSRLLQAQRAEEALVWLDKAAIGGARHGGMGAHPLAREHDRLRITALEQLGRRDEAQTARWRLFGESLSRDVLGDYLRALPDFEDDAALEQALALALRHPEAVRALDFLTRWPNLITAAKLVVERLGELDGRDYHVLEPAADALSDAQPLAATLLLRRMIDSVLDRAASTAYPHAAKNLAACEALDAQVDWSTSTWRSHTDYVADLSARHARKQAFWIRMKS
jgi:TPR repeat protein